MAYVGVHLDNASKYSSAIKRLKEIPEVVESHYTTGNWSIFIKILCKDNTHLMKVLNEEINFNIVELVDNTDLSGELACAGGACEIK